MPYIVYPPVSVGDVFGRLTVVEAASTINNGQKRWLCLCSCGKECIIQQTNLNRGVTRSCGCLSRELSKERNPRLNTTHGNTTQGKVTPTYRCWANMRARCSPNSKDFAYYGARGIRVCEAWESFEVFFHDMGEMPPGSQLDRIDNNGNYEPGNCRWASRIEQARNKRSNHKLSLHGETLTIAEWSERTGINFQTISSRVATGWTVEEALSPTRRRSKRDGMNGSSGFLYVVRSGDYFKIGRTSNLTRRLAALRRQFPNEMSVIYTQCVADMVQSERTLHTIFGERRIHGEWFELTDADVQAIKEGGLL